MMSPIVYDPIRRAWCHIPSGACSPVGPAGLGTPALPTYATVADVLEKKNGSGARLLAWSIARAALIAVPVKLALWRRVSWTEAALGGAAASAAISVLTLVRIKRAADEVNAAPPENFVVGPGPAGSPLQGCIGCAPPALRMR